MDNAPKKSKDIPATQGLLYEFRDELKLDISSVRSEVKSVRSEVKSVRAEVKSVRAEVESVRSEVKSVRAEVKALDAKLDAKFDQVLSAIHRVTAIVEEQENRNKYVLDGYTAITDRQDRFEKHTNERFDELEKLIKEH